MSLTRTLALELGKFNIRVNAVAPGLIDTPLTQGLREDVLEKLIQAQPTKTMGTPEDIAAVAAYLASDEAKFITGEVLRVEGGKSVGARVLSAFRRAMINCRILFVLSGLNFFQQRVARLSLIVVFSRRACIDMDLR